MRLLHFEDETPIHSEHDAQPLPRHAILSHTWAKNNEEEVTYEDICNLTADRKAAFRKLTFCRDQCHRNGIQHFWIDTCCIKQTDAIEVSGAIRSMFKWYQRADVCFVYLSDVSSKKSYDGEVGFEKAFRASRWFRRGWTLQELIAPTRLLFFASNGEPLGDKHDLCDLIAVSTSVPRRAFQGQLQSYDYLTRLSWINGRKTKKPEDLAYCLQGICDVSLDTRYGEGYDNAQSRLEREISFLCRNVLGNDHLLRRQRFFRLLQGSSPTNGRDAINDPHTTTCEWVFTNENFIAWRMASSAYGNHGILWIRGKAGIGKSVLLKHIENRITSEREEGHLYLAHYFNGQDPSGRSLSGLYASLLRQVFAAEEDLLDLLDDFTHGTMLERISTRPLQALLGKVIAQVKRKAIYFFVDALDQCEDEQDIRNLLDFVRNLHRVMSTDGPMLLTCCTSRYYPAMNVSDALQIELERSTGHESDLERFVRDKVQTESASQTLRVQDTIVKMARGLFLYAVIVSDRVKELQDRGADHDIERQLHGTQPALSNLYRDILTPRMENLHETVLAFQLILFARRPLTLHESYFAMMSIVAPLARQDNEDGAPSESRMLRYLKFTTRDLAELVERRSSVSGTLLQEPANMSPTVQLNHETIRAYLLSEECLRLTEQVSPYPLQTGHEAIKSCCAAALHSHAVQDGSAHRQRCQGSPFHDYAIEHILFHADSAASFVSQEKFVESFDWTYWQREYAALQALASADSNDNHELDASVGAGPQLAIHLCARYGFANMISLFADQGYVLTARSSPNNTTPFIEAVLNGHKTTAQQLLEHTGCTDPIVVLDQAFSIENLLAAGWRSAIEAQLDELALYLILEDETTKHDATRAEVLNCIASSGRSLLMKQLINEIWHLDMDSRLCSSALQTAIWDDKDTIVQIFIDAGMDMSKAFKNGRAPLTEAIFLGSTTVVPTLLNEGNVDVLDDYGRTALLHACDCQRWAVVQALLTAGADISIADCRGVDPLISACSSGHLDTVRALLLRGADPNTVSHIGFTSLGHAAFQGCVPIIKLLLEHAAKADTPHGELGRPLELAIQNQHIEAVELLRSYGASLNQGAGGVTESVPADGRETRAIAIDDRPRDPG